MRLKGTYREEDPLWYKDAIIYELHVKAFCDSTGDGMGDFPGLMEKLDYLEDLGITAIWLLPFYPSPLRDDGYDIADYFGLHPDYGTLQNFREFLKEAHRRKIRVITELVLNHTSDQHPWFQRARRARPGSVWRDFYVWSDTQERYQEARIIFKDFETSNWRWDPVARAHYWHRFYSHQPDLNYDNPRLQKEIFRVIDFWLRMGVDGLQLDGVPYLYEREGTNCENLLDTHLFLKRLRTRVEGKFKHRMLLAGANQWSEDAIAYFGEGDECHMAFHFPLMPRMFMALQMEDRFPIIDILDQTPPIPDSCQWALFLRNHDELTLEMVTDEERDYMYRVYARDSQARINLGIRRRLAPLLANNRRKIELMNVLLFYLPGTPILYYGDEIGMGDNYYLGDRNGVRTPMQWSPDRNAGFSQANPQKLYLPVIIDPEYHYEAVNVETQGRNLSSLLWWTKRVIAMRRRFQAFGRGSLDLLLPDNRKVLAFIRQYQEEIILVVVNLSRFSQIAEIDLSKYAGFTPEDIFSQNKFPVIKESPYMFTMGPYGYYLCLLQKGKKTIYLNKGRDIPEVDIKGKWKDELDSVAKKELEKILIGYLMGCHWFGGKSLTTQQVNITNDILISKDASIIHLLLLEVSYTEGLPEMYLLPLSLASKERARQIAEQFPQSVIARLRVGNGEKEEGILYDGVYDQEFHESLFQMIARKKRIRGEEGELVGWPGKTFRSLFSDRGPSLASHVLKANQSNTSILYENTFFLKLYRRLGEGVNPDLEIVRFLTEKPGFSHSPPFSGALEYRRPGSDPILMGQLQGVIPHQGDAWTYLLDVACRYFERVLSRGSEAREIPRPLPPLLAVDSPPDLSPCVEESVGGFPLEMASLLGKRTGELHLALSSGSEDPDFALEPFSVLYQRSVYQSMRNLVGGVMPPLGKTLSRLPEDIRREAAEILASEKEILNRLQRVLERKISAMKIRIHGNYHLGQVLYTGKDFVIIDFEGEPARALSERRLKRSSLRDVASMIRSFHYAAYRALLQHASVRPEDVALLEPWAELFFHSMSGIFLCSYLNTAGSAPFMPKEREELEILLQAFLLERAVYETGYELNNRPDWLLIPIKGIKHILKSS